MGTPPGVTLSVTRLIAAAALDQRCAAKEQAVFGATEAEVLLATVAQAPELNAGGRQGLPR
jgi:hypothetical protein